MQRDNFKCRFCGSSTESLHIHHAMYLPDKQPWEYDDPFLITVCHACHVDEERMKSEDPVLIGLFSLSGLSRRQLNYLAVELRRHFSGRDVNMKYQDLMDFLANT
jgi:hypothetical protein